jgi:hypothetical protein
MDWATRLRSTVDWGHVMGPRQTRSRRRVTKEDEGDDARLVMGSSKQEWQRRGSAAVVKNGDSLSSSHE